MGKLDGKVAVITGGSTGMALAGAKLFVDEGAHVFITGRRQDALDEAVKQIGRNVTGVQGDAADLDDLDRLYDTVKREKGSLDVLWASAGGASPPRSARSPRPSSTALLAQRPRHPVHRPEGPAALQRRRLHPHDRLQRLPRRLPRLERLRRQQGRPAGLGPHLAQRTQGPPHPRQRPDPRPGRHRQAGRTLRRGHQAASSSPSSPAERWAAPKKSPPPPSSSPPTTPATSTAWNSSPTAAPPPSDHTPEYRRPPATTQGRGKVAR